MSRSRRWLWILLVISSALAGLYLARREVLTSVARWLDVGEFPRHADYALVLGGGPNSRPFVAASLVRLGLARQVLVTRVASSPETDDKILRPEHELSREVLLYRGVPAEKIHFLGTENHTTFDEAMATSTFLETSPQATLTVVTNWFHTRRSRWIFAHVLGSRLRQVSFVSAPADGFRADNWWRSENGFSTIAGENVKMAGYVLFYDRVTQVGIIVVVVAMVLLLYRRRYVAARKASSDLSPAITSRSASENRDPRIADE
jgi:uncharacterized SAM-binding protein YcdF (DUF218 family)